MSRKSKLQSPALIVAVLVLVAALAGTAIAGPGAVTSKITKSKVKKIAGKQIDKRLPVGTGDIADGAVTSAKLADLAVTGPKLGDGAVTGVKLATIEVRTDTQPLPVSAANEATAGCNPGERLLAGGGRTAGPPSAALTDSHKQGEGWRVRAFNNTGTPGTVTAEAYCLAP